MNEEIKPSERIKELHDAFMVLDGKKPVPMAMYETSAIIKYLDEEFLKARHL